MNGGTKVFMLLDEKPVGIVSVTGSLIEDLTLCRVNRAGAVGLNCFDSQCGSAIVSTVLYF